MIKIGFTGTQLGISAIQHKILNYTLSGIYHHHFTEVEFHHGVCIGADEQAALMARNLGWKIVGHPPTNTSKMSSFVCDELLDPLPYLERNKIIVETTHLLIAAPNTRTNILRSGTWSTIRYAERLKKPIAYIFP